MSKTTINELEVNGQTYVLKGTESINRGINPVDIATELDARIKELRQQVNSRFGGKDE